MEGNLPENIIHDILLRLPVKSILKSKCVSKSWRSLICSPQFVKAHLNFSSKNADLTNHGIVFDTATLALTVRHCSISSLMSKRPIVASDVNYPNKIPYRDFWVVGSCNGIICITIDNKDIFLWNPSTRKFKLLPHPDVEMRKGYHVWGFGYSESEDDYKVVDMFGKDGNSHWHECIVNIYSLKSNLWKRIVDFNSCVGVPYRKTFRFASGKLHFAATSIMDDAYWNIVSFDLKTEALAIVQEPNYEEEDCSGFYLGTHGSCLSLICEYKGRERVDVWVMKEYNVKESWTIFASIPYFDNPYSLRDHSEQLLLILPNGDILLMLTHCLIVYNPKDNFIKYRRISNVQCFMMGAEVYFQSLVPI